MNMNQIPDENEEFELQYQDELDIMEEMNAETYNDFRSANNNNISVGDNNISAVETMNIITDTNSPQLSQISFNDDNLSQIADGSLQRQIFGTPIVSSKRIASTPLTNKNIYSHDNRPKRLPAIKEVVSLDDLAPLDYGPSTSERCLEPQCIPVANNNNKRKRLERELFGDMDDLFGIDETYEDPVSKKARSEEKKDLEMIGKILECRRQLREQNYTVQKDPLDRLKILHKFKMQNLSYTIPKWPFLPLRRSNGERIYVRFHSMDYETKAINDVITSASSCTSLLGTEKERIWNEANELILKHLDKELNEKKSPKKILPLSVYTQDNTKLWVDKYKPMKYIDLLSDETTNRSLLYWLKMWDKIVFGKEFKALQTLEINKTSVLNTLNKRTGKFESNGGWRSRKSKLFLNTNVDEFGRPIQKVALLCGPPGLGKTTLAHTIACHAGYNVREINASDDRSPEAFKLALENSTQMLTVGKDCHKPNCVVLDEIDGAPRQSIEFLVKFVTDNVTNMSKVKNGKRKTKGNILKRPIICICNDVYDPVLRPLRQIALIIVFPPIESARLADRLAYIADKEGLKSDFGSLIALAEKSGCDVRSCLATMQFYSAQKKTLTLHDVLNKNLGQKDRQKSLFDVWNSVFRINRAHKQLSEVITDTGSRAKVVLNDTSLSARACHVLEVVHSAGDFERLMQGVYENILNQKIANSIIEPVTLASEWFCFNDMLQHQISQYQNYTVYPYLKYAFVKWHFIFATYAWPKIKFPTKGYEFKQKQLTQMNILQSFVKNIKPTAAIAIGQGSKFLLETLPLLKRILSPQLRAVAIQLLSKREQNDLKHTVDVMADLGLTYIQTKMNEGSSAYRLEPDLETLAQFPDFAGITVSHFGRHLLAREIELENIHRSAPKIDNITTLKTTLTPSSSTTTTSSAATKSSINKLPNHLQRLQPKKLDKFTNAKVNQESVSKDFFGRIQRKTSTSHSLAINGKTDSIVKSPIWYRYKEGFNNAVRKDVHMYELL